ncbi:hypothetical protein NDU88_003964 [Pleurodeles waltl]|uniref:Uncharacterized protein n=1 Tax=Pleurodeles waltl TaxID=8319 RepID=A0AAV7LH85_PLEWA|nr:hypothetical protein NDU88_003964 [Pleurodeles waltl]
MSLINPRPSCTGALPAAASLTTNSTAEAAANSSWQTVFGCGNDHLKRAVADVRWTWPCPLPQGLPEDSSGLPEYRAAPEPPRPAAQRSGWTTSLAELAPVLGAGVMTSQRDTKKEGSLRDLFAKTPAKKVLPDEPPVMEDDTLEQAQDAREEELDCHRRELLALQDKNQELQYQIEDLGNRCRRSNIRIKGVSSQAVTGKLEDFIEHLFRYVAPDLKDQTVVLDRTHRDGLPAHSPGQAQDILTCLHHYKQRETIMAGGWDQPLIDFEGFRVGLFQDLFSLMLHRCRTLRPLTDFLRENNIRYKWGHPFRLQFVWQNETRAAHTIEEAQALEGMPPRLREMVPPPNDQEQRPRTDEGRLKTQPRRTKQHKPSTAESQKERVALFRRLRSQDSISDVDSDQ